MFGEWDPRAGIRMNSWKEKTPKNKMKLHGAGGVLETKGSILTIGNNLIHPLFLEMMLTDEFILEDHLR